MLRWRCATNIGHLLKHESMIQFHVATQVQWSKFVYYFELLMHNAHQQYNAQYFLSANALLPINTAKIQKTVAGAQN